MIDITKPPRELCREIVHVCSEHRSKWAGDWTKNFRRLSGWTEDDIKAAASNTDVASVNSAEPVTVHRATSFNLTRGYYQRLLGLVMPMLEGWQVLAASRDDGDIDAAEESTGVLRARTSPDTGSDFEAVLRTVSYLFCGGPAYLRVEASYTPGEEFGDVETAAVLPMAVHAFPGILEINDSPCIVLDEFLTFTQVLGRYPEFLETDKTIDIAAVAGAKWWDDVNFSDMSQKLGEGVYHIRRLMYRPSAKWPEGREVIFLWGAEEIQIERKELDTADRKYPLVQFSDVPMGPFLEDRGRMSISSHMQRAYDLIVSKALNLVLDYPQAAIGLPTGCNATRDDVTNGPVFMYDSVPGQRIAFDQFPGLGNLNELLPMVMSAYEEVHAQHGPRRGVSPGSRSSGRAIEQLITQDVEVDEPFLAMIRRAMGRVGKRILMEGKRVWPAEYLYRVLGKHRSYQTRAFQKANLKDGFDVRVMPDRGLPHNPAARMQLLTKAMGEGGLSDTLEGQRYREFAGIQVDTDGVPGADEAEEALIRQEEERLDNGEGPPVNWSDNHPMHFMRHRQLNTMRLASGKATPEVVAAAQAHSEIHKAEIDKVAAQAAAQAAAMAPQKAGGPQGGPGPG